MSYDNLDQDIIELGSVSTDTRGGPLGIDEHLNSLFVGTFGLASD